MKVSKKVSGVEYAIRDIVSAAKDLEKQGRTIEYLNIGDPVQYGFHPPENVKQAFIDELKKTRIIILHQKEFKNYVLLLLKKKTQRDFRLMQMMF